MTTLTLPVNLGICVPYAGGSATKASNFGAKPNDGTNKTPKKWQRSDASWWTNQPNQAAGTAVGKNSDTSAFKNDVKHTLDAAKANGYRLILMLGYCPQWARQSDTADAATDKSYPAHNEDYANYVWLIVDYAERNYPGVLGAVEIWNEPNQSPFMRVHDVTLYVPMLEAAYDAVKTGVIGAQAARTAYPNMQIITGGTGAAPAVGNANRHLNWSRYIIQNTTKFDHIGIHAYPSDGPLGAHNGWDPGYNDIEGYSNVVGGVPHGISWELHDASNDTAQIINTEAGWDTPHTTSLQHAADYLDTTWSWWTARSGARDGGLTNLGCGIFCLYECDDTAKAGTDPNANDGLYGQGTGQGDGTAKTTGSPAVPVFLNKWLALAGATGSDTTAPTGSWVTAAGTLTGSFEIHFKFSDNVTSAANLSVVASKDGGTSFPITCEYVSGQTGWTHRIKGASGTVFGADGTYGVTARATDGAGNVSTALTVRNFVVSNGSAAPTVTGLSPSSGTNAGNVLVTVTGTGFALGMTATLGGDACTSVTFVNSTSCTLRTPARPAGTDYLKVTVGGVTSAAVAADKYTSTASGSGPTVLGLNPTHGPPAGGERLSVHVDTSTGIDQIKIGTTPIVGSSLTIGFATGGGTPTNANIDIDDTAGAKVIRLGITWDTGSSTPDRNFDRTTGIAACVAYLNSKGIIPILNLTIGATYAGSAFTHSYSNAGGGLGVNGTDVVVEFSKWCANVAAFFSDTTPGQPKYVLACEIHNEPNHAKTNNPLAPDKVTPNPNFVAFGGPAEKLYAETLIRITSSDWENTGGTRYACKIISAGLGGESDRQGINSFAFFKNTTASVTFGGHTYSQGIWGHCDGMSIHPYCYDLLPSQDTNQSSPNGWLNMLQILDWQQSTFGSILDVYITEFGQPTQPENDATWQHQADSFNDAVRLLKQYAGSGSKVASTSTATDPWNTVVFCWFSDINNDKANLPAGAHDNDMGVMFGNLDTGHAYGDPKPHIYAAFQTAANATTAAFTIDDATHVSFPVPPLPAGADLHVTVHNASGWSAVGPADLFSVDSQGPVETITKIVGSTTVNGPFGSTPVQITGTQFDVYFTGVDDVDTSLTAAGIELLNGTALADAHPTGNPNEYKATVLVTAFGGATSATIRATGTDSDTNKTYSGNVPLTITVTQPPPGPVVGSIVPNSGAAGDIVTINGTNLRAGMVVKFGQTVATVLSVAADGKSATVRVPA